MPQPHESATYQLYQAYHAQVNRASGVETYEHFGAVSRSSTDTQQELLTGYMGKMIDSIAEDVRGGGDCWLLRAIASHELPAIHVLDRSAICYVYTSLFFPEELPRLDTRSIPFTSDLSRSTGGMLYQDPKTRYHTLDLRQDNELALLCNALQMYARQQELQNRLASASEEKTALNSRIAGLNDQLLGLQRDLSEARKPSAEEPAPAQRPELLPLTALHARLHQLAHPDDPEAPAPSREDCASLLAQLEAAMQPMGFRFIRPEAGEAYDPARHQVVRHDGEPIPDAVVDHCVTPGVAAGEQLLRPARVCIKAAAGEKAPVAP